MLYIKESFANHSHGEHRSIACKSPWLIEADGHCGQVSVEYDQFRLAATGI